MSDKSDTTDTDPTANRTPQNFISRAISREDLEDNAIEPSNENMSETGTAIDWQKFFATARGWIFQAAPSRPGDEDKPSIGSMESMYQAFKARMLVEQELDMTHDF